MPSRWILFALIALAVAGCETTRTAVHETRQVMARKPVVEVAAEDGAFSSLVTALKAAGLDEALRDKGPYTLFAPTDEAFGQLPEGTLGKLLLDKVKLAAILKYHVIAAEVTSDKIVPGSLKTIGGQFLPVNTDGKKITVGEASVTRGNIAARNGVIHAIDKVLMPPEK